MNTPDKPDTDRPDVDRVLRDAGSAWRAGQPPAPAPDLMRIRGDRFRSRRWVPALAAASVAAIAATIAIVANGSGDPTTGPAETTQSTTPSTGQPTGEATGQPTGQPTGRLTGAGQAALVVRDGDVVEMSGEIIAAPGKPVIYCAPHAVSAVGYPPGKEPAPSCPAGLSVTVTGVDLDRLSQAGTRKGVRFGNATLRGVWRNRSVDVSEQSASRQQQPSADDFPPVKPPCPAPAGGWRPGSAAANDSNAFTAAVNFVEAHPNRFGKVWIGWPDGHPTNSAPTPDPHLPQVLVVEVVEGDLAQTHRELAKLYDGNLCMERAKYSSATRQRVQASLRPLIDSRANGISGYGSGMGNRGVSVDLLMVTEKLYADFTKIGLDLVELDPAIRPIR